MTIQQIDEILFEWIQGFKTLVEVHVQIAFPNDGPWRDVWTRGARYPDRSPCENCDHYWCFRIDRGMSDDPILFNFGIVVDEDGNCGSKLCAARCVMPSEDWTCEEDKENWMATSLDKWHCWTYAIVDPASLKEDLLYERWALELNEPNHHLDPRPFLITKNDKYILDIIAETLNKIKETLDPPCEERDSANLISEFLASLPDVSKKADYIHRDVSYWKWNPILRIEAIFSAEEEFHYEIGPTWLLLEWEDISHTSWNLARGNLGAESDPAVAGLHLSAAECAIHTCEGMEFKKGKTDYYIWGKIVSP